MESLKAKLLAALVPGLIVEFEPDEADQVGAILEDAITIDDAIASAPDLLDDVP